jgi:hypothetical protein
VLNLTLALVITTRLDNMHTDLLPLQRPGKRLACPKDRRVKSQRALYRGQTLPLPGILNTIRPYGRYDLGPFVRLLLVGKVASDKA